ncbi:FIST signal transduction protein [Rivibacter subsaxonicus]|uniref:Small ligand-binding sensory domain FIST n=1 Tax=Rivibacter subsaxonicus TaxID=457575 RepID=A0A4Q7VX61_9BURK|nr:FIST N-terminal domain-containing protein [Rivibacter subsaxonicus]RZU01105.1 small ligand-binding sensory domain FIST [Rivibacter subsaxonicus]
MTTLVAPRFAAAHAMHPDWRMALSLVLAQLDPLAPPAPTLGWCYLADHHAPHADELLVALRERWPGCAWVGAVGVGVCASGVEYFDEPGLVLMLSDLPAAQFRLFSGREPLAAQVGFTAHAAQVHADPGTQDLAELVAELAERTDGGYLFGGLASSRTRVVTLADGVFEGGLSGVAFGADVAMLSRVTQGCQPVGPARRVTEVERNVVFALDGQPALDLLFADLGVSEEHPREALGALRHTLVGVSDGDARAITHPGQFGTDVRVRHLVGIDPGRRGIAIADHAEPGQQIAFCRRDVEAARRDLVRIAAEIRSELEPEELGYDADQSGGAGARRIVGALYASCTGRGGPHFGAPSAEMQILRHALGGDVPLAGFFAAGEIGHRHLYGYTGVLTVFTAPA